MYWNVCKHLGKIFIYKIKVLKVFLYWPKAQYKAVMLFSLYGKYV